MFVNLSDTGTVEIKYKKIIYNKKLIDTVDHHFKICHGEV